MNSFSVRISYPTSTRVSPSSFHESCPHSPKVSNYPGHQRPTVVSNRITCPQGIVGCYDITQLDHDLRYFGISEETKEAIKRKQKSTKQSGARSGTTTQTTLCDTLYTNRKCELKSREPLTSAPRSALTRSCYVDFTGSFKDAVQAQSFPLATRHAALVTRPRPRSDYLPKKLSTDTRAKRPKPTLTRNRKQPGVSEPAHIEKGLLVIANGQIVDLKKDIQQSEKMDDKERKRLRKEMRKHMDIVRSFDELLQEFEATTLQLEELKAT